MYYNNWRRASSSNPCPLCGRRKTCSWVGAPGGLQVVCCWTKKSSRRARNGLGWLHFFNHHRQGRRPQPRANDTVVPLANVTVFERLQRACRRALDPTDVDWLAGELGVSAPSLRRLGIGTYPPWECLTFPMRDGRGRVIGLCTRCPRTGVKRSISGSRSGLFFDPQQQFENRHVLVCEGPTDAAAGLDLGLPAVGRADCGSGARLVMQLFRDHQPTCLTIVADRDDVGRQGARLLANYLRLVVPSVRVVIAPCQDLRESVRRLGRENTQRGLRWLGKHR